MLVGTLIARLIGKLDSEEATFKNSKLGYNQECSFHRSQQKTRPLWPPGAVQCVETGYCGFDLIARVQCHHWYEMGLIELLHVTQPRFQFELHKFKIAITIIK
ncbi:hypothetical protein BpHYR1_000283 [Brachionus plicatilis]|uniref:Uncharacterized protein n=1 Tax=Brachionus plicatilis TaxID=10195 RepID=A0A3M7TAW8_BRAPC|nr:hypothetical protein BpHYR1_000283 [Brachionus plicatilis]